MVLRLLDHGDRTEAAANAKPGGDHDMLSALHAAIEHGHERVVKLLLQHGADPNADEYRGLTALELAKQMEVNGKDVSNMLEPLGKHD